MLYGALISLIQEQAHCSSHSMARIMNQKYFRILLLGKDGQLGTALQPQLEPFGAIVAHNRATCDLGNAEQLQDVIRSVRPNLIVNAAAYTAVDKAETELDICHRINAEAPGILAAEAKAIGAWLVHYSTDYVFDGIKTDAYREEDLCNPLNAYGHSKLAGDLAIAAATENHTILRVSWVYGTSGRNFAKTILRLAMEREELRIVDDQFGAPTSVDLIAETTIKIIGRHLDIPDFKSAGPARGLFNVASSGRISWYQFAVELLREAARQGWPLKLSADKVIPIPTEQYPTPAARPKNSVLETTKVRHLLGCDLPVWRAPIEDFVARLRQMEKTA